MCTKLMYLSLCFTVNISFRTPRNARRVIDVMHVYVDTLVKFVSFLFICIFDRPLDLAV